MLLWLYNSRYFISHSVPICDSRQIMWHLHYLYHKRLWFCWSSSVLKLVVFFACIGVGERKVILFIMLYYWHQNLVFLTYMLSNWSSSIPFVFFCMIKSMQNVKRRGESRYFFFTPVHSIVLFHKYFLAFKSVNTILIDLRHEYPRFQNDREYLIYG